VLRKELVAPLKTVAPALSTLDIIPVLSCFCFDGETVTAYNDVIAISTPLATTFRGAVQGRPLLDLLGACKAKSVEAAEAGSTLNMKVGRSKFRLPMLPEEDFAYTPPEEEGESVVWSKECYEAFKRVLVSMGEDSFYLWRSGVTVSFEGRTAVFYSTDNVTVSRHEVKLSGGSKLKGRVITMPTQFCEILAGFREGRLFVGSSWVGIENEAGTFVLARLVEDSRLDEYEAMFAELPEERFALPAAFGSALDRAAVVVDSDKATGIQVTGTAIRLKTESMVGVVRDSMKFEHDGEIRVFVMPALLRRALELTRVALFLEDRIVFGEDGFTHIVAVVS